MLWKLLAAGSRQAQAAGSSKPAIMINVPARHEKLCFSRMAPMGVKNVGKSTQKVHIASS